MEKEKINQREEKFCVCFENEGYNTKVESGNQKFEVRSNNDELGINKGQTIHVDEYEIKYKHKR